MVAILFYIFFGCISWMMWKDSQAMTKAYLAMEESK